MKRLRNWLAGLCPVLLLAASQAQADTAIWSDNFETNVPSRWQLSGAWKIGSPTAGPPVGASGYRTHSGTNCASTQSYAYDKDGRLVFTRYNGATSLLVPAAGQFPRLRFWHWFNFANALGYVEISINQGSTWTQISPTYENDNGGGIWSQPYIDLSAYAGDNILIAFHFTSGGCCGNSLGWFVDDVEVDVDEPVLNFPEGFEFDPKMTDWSVDSGTWEMGRPTSGPEGAYLGTNCAATVLAGNYGNNVDSRLISPPFVVPAGVDDTLRFAQWYSFNNALGYVEVSTGNDNTGTVVVTNTVITTNTTGTLNTNIYQIYNALITGYSTPFYWNSTIGGWTNATKALGSVVDFTYGQYFFEGGYSPLASVGSQDNVDYRATNLPSPLTITATNFIVWQGMTWFSPNDSLDNPVGYFGTNSTYTYTTNITTSTNTVDLGDWLQISPTYMNTSSGGWTNAAFDLSTYAGQTVQVAFHFTSGGSVTDPGWYVDDIRLGAVPVLTVPTNQTIYAGETLTVTNDAGDPFATNSVFTFGLLDPIPSGVDLDPDTGILTWPTTPQQTGTYTIIVTAQDSVSQLITTNQFKVVVSKAPPPTLTVPSKKGIYAGQTLTVTNTASSVFGPDSTFTFALLSGLTNTQAGLDLSGLADNGVLSWTTQTNLAVGSYTNKITVEDSVSELFATNSFVIVVSNNPPAPTLTVPGKQAIFAGQTLIVTNTATSVFGANSSFTFTLLSGLTNTQAGLDVSGLASNGILRWVTTTSLTAGNYTNKVSVEDSLSGRLATNSFVVVVSNAPPPTLTVPAKQILYGGQSLTVTNVATSVYGTNSTFTFALLAGLTNSLAGLNLSGLTNNGVLSWSTKTNLGAGNYTNKVSVEDSLTGLFATNSFVIVVSNPPPPLLTTVPPVPSMVAGQTLIVTNSATSVYGTNSTFTFTLFIGQNNVNVSTNGVLRWATTVRQPAGRYTNTVTVVDSVSQLGASNQFVSVVTSNTPVPPTLTVPPAQTIYAGLTLTVTNLATNSAYPGCSFTFGLVPPVLPGATVGTNTGVLTWPTTTAQAPGTYTNIVTVSDSASLLSVTNSFLVQVLPPQPPTLIVPTTQLVYADQLLVLTNYATNIYPGSTFSFIAFGPSNLDLSDLPNNGVIRWTPTAAQAPSENTIYVKVTDNNSLSSQSNFLVLVASPPAPEMAARPGQKSFGTNGFQFTLTTQPNITWQIDASSNLLNWNAVFTNMADSSGTLQLTDLLATNFPLRFYRAVLP